jgi:hypothetical protein
MPSGGKRKQKLQHEPYGQSKLTSFFPVAAKAPPASGNENVLPTTKTPSASNRGRRNDTTLGSDLDSDLPRVDSSRQQKMVLWKARELEINNLLSSHKFAPNTDGTMDPVSNEFVCLSLHMA